jgi:hypothetical protein
MLVRFVASCRRHIDAISVVHDAVETARRMTADVK